MGGIRGVLYTLTNLTRADVAQVCRRLFEDWRARGDLNMLLPTMDFDSNNVCHVVARKSDIKSIAVGEYLNQWAHCAIKAVPVVDGDERPAAKQASNERRANREKSRIEGHILLKEANKIRSDLASGLVASDKLAETTELLLDKEKAIRKNLAASVDCVPSDFAEALEDAIINDVAARIPNETGGFVPPVLKSRCQADAAIVDRFLKKQALMAVTNDADIYILAGDELRN